MATMFTDKEHAEKWIAKALEISGNDIRTQLAVGQFRLRSNRLVDAKQHADKALELDPNGMEANALAGVVARLQEDYPTAIKHLSAAHLLRPRTRRSSIIWRSVCPKCPTSKTGSVPCSLRN